VRILNYDEAHDWVSNNSRALWDGWDIVIWKRNPNGATNKKGLYRNGSWGIADRYSVNSDGNWRIPNKHDNTN
jgi:hypothetical protein